MSWNLIVRPEAEQDITEVYDWYEEQRKGLGDEFLLEIGAGLNFIQSDPYIYAPIYKDIRRALSRRFLYGIFYFVSDNNIAVFTVMHTKKTRVHGNENKKVFIIVTISYSLPCNLYGILMN
jgi:toxin ParE1/3/4